MTVVAKANENVEATAPSSKSLIRSTIVRKYCKEVGYAMAAEVPNALDALCREFIKKAMVRAEAAKRKTIKSVDI